MDIIVKTVSRIMFPFILVFGVYMALHGHLSPGGAFPAGAVIASGFVLLFLAYSGLEYKILGNRLIGVMALGMLTVIAIHAGYTFRAELLGIQTPMGIWSGGFTIILNVIGSMVIAAALIVLIYSMLREKG